jgi:16S rRNA (guanine966-N2)-methyltransferase
MRISGGAARGVVLSVPKGEAVRPATDGMRQSVFSSLGGYVQNARFLDLFAGSGAYGLEALSRGASGGAFVEKSPRALDCLKRNITAVCKSLKQEEKVVRVVHGDVLEWALGSLTYKPDVIFVDPPYDMIADVAPKLFERIDALLGPDSDGLVVFEMPGELTLAPTGWTCIKRLGGGVRQPTVSFFRPSRNLP